LINKKPRPEDAVFMKSAIFGTLKCRPMLWL